MAVGIFRPHIPWYVPSQFFDRYPLAEVEVPYNRPGWFARLPPAGQKSGAARRRWHQWLVDSNEWKSAVQGYLASITFADYQLGRLLDGLAASDHAEDTIVVLWTDHGFHLGDKTTWEKFTLWEESTQVPLIVKVPGVTTAGSVCHRPASLVDLYPTILELCGLAANAPKSLEGTSLVPQLRDVEAPRKVPALCTNGRNNHSIRDERFHLICYANGDRELYDHTVDESEWNNLAQDPQYADEMLRLSKWLPSINAAPAPGGGNNGAGGRKGAGAKKRTGKKRRAD